MLLFIKSNLAKVIFLEPLGMFCADVVPATDKLSAALRRRAMRGRTETSQIAMEW